MLLLPGVVNGPGKLRPAGGRLCAAMMAAVLLFSGLRAGEAPSVGPVRVKELRTGMEDSSEWRISYSLERFSSCWAAIWLSV